MTRPTSSRGESLSRRRFLSRSAAVGASTATALMISRGAHAAGSDRLRFGLIGCGGRGGGAAADALNAAEDAQLVAMADLFPERMEGARERLQNMFSDRAAVRDDHCFVGIDAYRELIASDVDVVMCAAASHFHPVHFEEAVAAGKHIFCEKPHALDVPGIRRVISACELAKEKNLCIVSGLCWRYDVAARETVARVLDGQIGDVVAIEETYLSSPYGVRARHPGASEMEHQLRSWYRFNWLSGDQMGQQVIHSVDKASWVLGDAPPERAFGVGGQQVGTGPEFGDVFDHNATVYEYANGVRVYAFGANFTGAHTQTADVVLGTKGRATITPEFRIEGENPWRFRGTRPSMTQLEQKALFDAIRNGERIDNSDYMITSTLLGILAQMACYTGQRITWEQLLESELDFTSPSYAYDAEAPVKPGLDGRYPTAKPGLTPFV